MYTNGQYEVRLVRRGDLNTVADITGATWGPALVPHVVRGVALLIDNDIGATGTVRLDKRPTFGSNTGRGDGDVAIINLATTHTGGKVVYKETNVLIKPGEEVVAEVTDATAAADTADVILFVEPQYEVAINNTAMVVTT